MGGSAATETSANMSLRERLVDEALTDANRSFKPAGEDISLGAAADDYAYVDRSFGGAVLYDADGTTSNIDFVGNENTFVLDASL